MPAPAAALMSKQCLGLYGMPLGPEAIKYLDMVFGNIEKAWKKWQSGIQIGALQVAGAGIGVWAGASLPGGKLVPGDPMKIDPISFAKNSPEQKKFTTEIFTAVEMKFDLWVPTYNFLVVQYVGTSGASPVSPGPVSALNVSAPLKALGAAPPLSGIAAIAKAKLTPPMFNLSAPEAKSGQLVDAIGKAIETAFETIWLTSTQVSGSQLLATGAPGGVVPPSPSTPGGKLI